MEKRSSPSILKRLLSFLRCTIFLCQFFRSSSSSEVISIIFQEKAVQSLMLTSPWRNIQHLYDKVKIDFLSTLVLLYMFIIS